MNGKKHTILAALGLIALVILALGTGAYWGALSALRMVDFAQPSGTTPSAPIDSAISDARDLAAQEEMAFWAKWMFVVSLSGTIGLLLQIGLTRKALNIAQIANKISERVGRAQTRCYVSMKSCEVKIEADGTVTAILLAHNSGQSPARQMSAEVAVIIHHPHAGWRWRSPPFRCAAPTDLSADTHERLWFKLPGLVSQGDLSDLLLHRQLMIRVHCNARWHDVFHESGTEFDAGGWWFESECTFLDFGSNMQIRRINFVAEDPVETPH